MKYTALTVFSCILLGFSSPAKAQSFVDYGLLEGFFFNEGVQLTEDEGRFELGIFTGYSDAQGTSFFSGKDYTTLRGSFTPFASSITALQAGGQMYQPVELVGATEGTRLFAWVFSTTAASESANWTIMSGVIGGSGPTDASWFVPTPPLIPFIELGTTGNFLYANSNPGNSLTPNEFLPIGADISVVPEPATTYLLIAGAAVFAWRLRSRFRKTSGRGA